MTKWRNAGVHLNMKNGLINYLTPMCQMGKFTLKTAHSRCTIDRKKYCRSVLYYIILYVIYQVK